MNSQETKRWQVRVRGRVQGVGFRPHVFRLAHECQLTGWVRNDGKGVFLEIQGIAGEEFLRRLRDELPPLAHVHSLQSEEVPTEPQESGFTIVASETTAVTTSIVPDAATCPDCLREALSSPDPRFGYPFLNCTHCGPRYTITKKLPYDRAQTSMASFPMCPQCEQEYHNPLDRRFHAQPTACPICGPALSHSLKFIANSLRQGRILAIKGLGGFHLVCDAHNHQAVSELRRRKQRDAKPFAIMVANVASARLFVDMPNSAEKILRGIEKPIVILPLRPKQEGDSSQSALSPAVAPGMTSLGVMVPYTPLHHLLFQEFLGENEPEAPCPIALVMTSANPGGEPLVIANEEATLRLSAIADDIVTHNRDIVVRVDDSVVTLVKDAPFFIRRARGYVPRAIQLPHAIPPTLAFGADLKNTITVTRGAEAFVSQHIGDLDNAATIEFQSETVRHLLSILQVVPERVVSDLHPDFASTRAAIAFARDHGIPHVTLQHHHAHIGATMAEHHVQGPLLGLALDGFGLGSDGGSWGGELILAQGTTMTRLGHLRPLHQPGGDVAAREPWRMGAAALWEMGLSAKIAEHFSHLTTQSGRTPHPELLAQMLNLSLHCPTTSGAGRWFDAACGLLRIQDFAAFEGQAPMKLEALCRHPRPLSEGFLLEERDGLSILNLLPTLRWLAEHPDPQEGADIFHGTLIAGLAAWVNEAALGYGMRTVVLSGGCFLNRVLTEGLMTTLESQGFAVLIPRELPPNDGCISLGQAWLGRV